MEFFVTEYVFPTKAHDIVRFFFSSINWFFCLKLGSKIVSNVLIFFQHVYAVGSFVLCYECWVVCIVNFFELSSTNSNINLGCSVLLYYGRWIFKKKRYICHINSYFGKGKMYLLFMEFYKCVHICVKTYGDVCCTMSLWKCHMLSCLFVALHLNVYSKLFIFISLHNNWIVSLSNFLVLGMCESYIVQHKLGVDMWIFTNIQWSLFMNMCWRYFLTHVHFFPMIAYVCCSYPNDCNFSTYNICITLLRCWSFSHMFGSRRIFSSTLVNWRSSIQ